MKHLFKFLPLLSALSAFAGTATIFTDNQSTPFASGAGTVNFNSYNASSITVTVSASAYGGSQQGGGRNYSGYAEAVIGGSNENQDVPNGSDPMNVSALNTLTVTKGGDGNWYSGGTNLGTSVSVSAYVTVDGENVQGGATAYCTVNWVEAPINTAPSIVWTSSPGSAASGQSYTISAHGHDADDNLALVRVWKNGVLLASAGGGDGTDSEASDSTSDTGPVSVTFTAQATDTAGVTSALITQTVAVAAAPPPVVTAAVSASPSVLTAPGSTTVTWSSAHATAVAVTGNGLSSTAASGSQIVSGLAAGAHTFTIAAQGNGGPATDTASVTVHAPVVVSATISASPTTDTAPGAATITWSSANATSVTVSGSGLNSTATSGSQAVSNLPSGSYDYTIIAQGPNGPATQTATVTVTPAPTVAGSISISPATGTEPASATVTWTTSDASLVTVSGPGLSTVAASGSQLLTGLAAGTHTYTLTAQGNGGPVTRTAAITVAAVGSVSATISASPTASIAPGSTTLTWSSTDATSVLVNGPGLTSTAASGSQTITGLAAGTHDYTITAQGPNGPATQTATLAVSAAATVAGAISASPTTGLAPGSTTLTWSTSSASSVAVSGPGLSSTATAGSQTVTGLAAGTHTFTLTAQGPGGPITRTATYTVSAAVSVSGTIAVSPTTTTAPGAATVTWSTTNATSVVVSGPGVANGAASGSATVTGLSAGTHTFTLTAQGPGGPITQTATLTVSAAATVSGSIVANPTTTTAPGATTLTWSTASATSAFVSGPGFASAALSGTQIVSGLAAGTHTFTLTAQGNGGPVTRTATVTVTPGAGLTAALSVSPGTVNMGGNAMLSWSTANATSVRVSGFGISGTPYETNPTFTINIGGLLPGQSTWTLVAEGPGGPVTRTATINVNSTDGLYGSLTVNPTVIYSNQSATLAWTSSGTNFKWVHGYRPGNNGVFVYPAPINGSTAVSGLAPGYYSFVFEYGPGSLSPTRSAYAYLTVLGVNRNIAATVAPVGAGAVTGAGTYREGLSVTLTATPDSAHVFSGWSGDLTGAVNPLTFTVGARDYAVVANFSPRTYAVAVAVAPAGSGSVTGAGSYSAGSTANLTASADSTHAFTGWTGDLTSAANPLSFVVNGGVNLTANFATTGFALTTAASGGGTVTPGGVYPAGTVVTLTATPDALCRFTAWSGDAAGAATSTAVTVDRAKFVQANFIGKTAQTISFTPPSDHGITAPPFALSASASSGLPVSFSLLSGPAILSGSTVELTGAGPVTLQASQPGDAFFLPAAPVNQTFNVIAAASLKYRGQSRTLLRDETTRAAPPFVLEKP